MIAVLSIALSLPSKARPDPSSKPSVSYERSRSIRTDLSRISVNKCVKCLPPRKLFDLAHFKVAERRMKVLQMDDGVYTGE